MRRAIVLAILLTSIVCFGGAVLTLITAGGHFLVSAWFVAAILLGLLGMLLDELP